MSFFDRMANIGKGVGKVWAKNAKGALDRLSDTAENWGDETPPADPVERKLRLLEKLRDEGLLNDEEYRAKRAAVLQLDEPAVSAEQPTRKKGRSLDPPDDAPAKGPDDEPVDRPDKPRKRNL